MKAQEFKSIIQQQRSQQQCSQQLRMYTEPFLASVRVACVYTRLGGSLVTSLTLDWSIACLLTTRHCSLPDISESYIGPVSPDSSVLSYTG